MDVCCKEQFHGQCCCECRHQEAIKKHPKNKASGKGSIYEVMGYGCRAPELWGDDEAPSLIFFEERHGICELFEPRKARPLVEEDPALAVVAKHFNHI